MLAISGEDPYNIELLMRRRGEYRPHQDFGVNLSIPWNAGSQEEATWEVASGSVYTTTQGIGHKAGPRAELGWQAQVAAATEALNGGFAAKGNGGGSVGSVGPGSASGAGSSVGESWSWSGAKKVPQAESAEEKSRRRELALVDEERKSEEMRNELAVVEAPRVRELGLYEDHTLNYLAHYGDQAELGKNVEERPWEAVSTRRMTF